MEISRIPDQLSLQKMLTTPENVNIGKGGLFGQPTPQAADVLDGGRRRLLPPALRGECGRGARGADLSNLDGPLLGDSFWIFSPPRA